MDAQQTKFNILADAVNNALMSDYIALYFDRREMLDAGREAFAAIVSRLRALEAFVGELAAYKSATWESEYHCGLDMARDEIADRAAALLAASEEAKP